MAICESPFTISPNIIKFLRPWRSDKFPATGEKINCAKDISAMINPNACPAAPKVFR